LAKVRGTRGSMGSSWNLSQLRKLRKDNGWHGDQYNDDGVRFSFGKMVRGLGIIGRQQLADMLGFQEGHAMDQVMQAVQCARLRGDRLRFIISEMNSLRRVRCSGRSS
jgi:hypothetical protein